MEMYRRSPERCGEFWRAVQEMWLKMYSSNLVTIAAITVGFSSPSADKLGELPLASHKMSVFHFYQGFNFAFALINFNNMLFHILSHVFPPVGMSFKHSIFLLLLLLSNFKTQLKKCCAC